MRHLDNLLGQLATLPPEQAMLTLIVGSLACIFWLFVYWISIWQAWKQKTTCIPMVAICLNFTWELLASTVFQNQTPVPGWLFLERAWLVFDAVILAQLFLYGRSQQKIPEIRDNFVVVTIGTLIFCLCGHYTFERFCGEEPIMLPDALVINTIMSALFPFLYFSRRDLVGISLPVAWLKMLGTLCNSIAMYWYVPVFYTRTSTWPFMYYLSAAIFVLDCTYIYLVTKATRAAQAA